MRSRTSRRKRSIRVPEVPFFVFCGRENRAVLSGLASQRGSFLSFLSSQKSNRGYFCCFRDPTNAPYHGECSPKRRLYRHEINLSRLQARPARSARPGTGLASPSSCSGTGPLNVVSTRRVHIPPPFLDTAPLKTERAPKARAMAPKAHVDGGRLRSP